MEAAPDPMMIAMAPAILSMLALPGMQGFALLALLLGVAV